MQSADVVAQTEVIVERLRLCVEQAQAEYLASQSDAEKAARRLRLYNAVAALNNILLRGDNNARSAGA